MFKMFVLNLLVQLYLEGQYESTIMYVFLGVTSTQPKTVTPSSLTTVTNATGLLMPVVKNVKSSLPTKKVPQKSSKPQKTILIKNQLGQTVSISLTN